jgi:hypothetical protein
MRFFKILDKANRIVLLLSAYIPSILSTLQKAIQILNDYKSQLLNTKVLFANDCIGEEAILKSKNFIDSREPSYYLGSSRLFAIKAGIRVPEPNEIETPEIIQKALQTKKDFGDIDLDVYFNDGVSTANIKDFLNNFTSNLL